RGVACFSESAATAAIRAAPVRFGPVYTTMGSEATGPSASSADGFSTGGCSPAVKKVTTLSPPLAEPPALAALVSSSSSLAGLWRLPPHISSRRFGGEASIGTRL